MKNLKIIMMMGFMILIVTLSKPVMALELGSFTDVPNFSVIIGGSMYTLDYANDPTNANQISTAVAENKGDVFIKTDDTGWIKNSDGTQVMQDSVDISTIKYNNGQEIVPTVSSVVSRIQVNSDLKKTGTNTMTFTYKILDKNELDITKTIPASEIVAITYVSSIIALDPATGIGTITFDSSADMSTSLYVTLTDKNTGVDGTSAPSTVVQIKVSPTITKTGLNTATFQYKIINQRGTDVTKITPASELSVSASVSSTIVLDPATGIGTITFNSLVDTSVNITLTDKNSGATGSSAPSKISSISVDPTIKKTGLNTATFEYTLLNLNNNGITENIPASELSAIASVNSTIVLDPTTGIGTITYNSPADIDTSINITLTDKITGTTGSSVMIAPVAVTEEPKVSKIAITTTGLGISGQRGYATFCVYDQYGNNVTMSSLGSNVTFKSNIGAITARYGLLTLTANAGIDFSTLSSVVITGTDPVNGFSATFTLKVFVPIQD